MRTYETKIQELKASVLREVAALAWEDNLAKGVLDVPEKLIPGPRATMRCCIYKERAIIGDRIKLAMGGDTSDPGIVEVIPTACDECPVTQMTVGPSCRGCLATRCVHACPKEAITVVNHRAQIDHAKCIVCGKCLNACPYSAIVQNRRPCEKGCPVNAISMGEDKKASIDHSKCISCGTCVYTCPFGAIMDKSWIVTAVEMLKSDSRVYAIVAPAVAGQFGVGIGQVASGLKALGFRGVEEVALGADLTAHEEARELADKGLLFSSCCPAFVDYVEKFHPKLADTVSQTPSPMVMAARRVKERDPEARVIFVGPCVAKKNEFQLEKTGGAVDCVLTFEEADAMFEARGIRLEELPDDGLDSASSYGRNFAHSGGVSAAVAQAVKEQGLDFTVKAVPCSGIAECKVALLKAGRNLLDGNFIEGMACEGGCVAGAACLVRSPKNRAEVEKHAKQAGERTIQEAIEG